MIIDLSVIQLQYHFLFINHYLLQVILYTRVYVYNNLV